MRIYSRSGATMISLEFPWHEKKCVIDTAQSSHQGFTWSHWSFRSYESWAMYLELQNNCSPHRRHIKSLYPFCHGTCFLERIRKKVRSFIGSRSRTTLLAWSGWHDMPHPATWIWWIWMSSRMWLFDFGLNSVIFFFLTLDQLPFAYWQVAKTTVRWKSGAIPCNPLWVLRSLDVNHSKCGIHGKSLTKCEA